MEDELRLSVEDLKVGSIGLELFEDIWWGECGGLSIELGYSLTLLC